MTLSNKNERCKCSRPAAFVWFAAGLVVLLCATQACADSDSIHVLIQKAGNAKSDEVRLDYLKQIRQQPDRFLGRRQQLVW